jgi:hypothetical protein
MMAARLSFQQIVDMPLDVMLSNLTLWNMFANLKALTQRKIAFP